MTPIARALSALVLPSVVFVAACSSDSGSSSTSTADAGAPVAADASSSSDTGAPPAADAGPSTPPVVADAGTAKAQWKLRLTVPRDYTGTPRQLAVVLVDSLPVAGIPAAFLKLVESPTIAAGQELALTGDVPANRGRFKVLAALYMQGGGQFSPKPGTDYDAATSAFVELTGGPVDFGALPLALHTATDGH